MIGKIWPNIQGQYVFGTKKKLWENDQIKTENDEVSLKANA